MAAEQDAAAQKTGGSDPSTAYALTPLAGTRSSSEAAGKFCGRCRARPPASSQGGTEDGADARDPDLHHREWEGRREAALIFPLLAASFSDDKLDCLLSRVHRQGHDAEKAIADRAAWKNLHAG